MPFEMRPSRVIRRMREGKVAVCGKLNLSDLRGVEICAMSGMDCLWIDQEHIPNDLSFVEHAVMVAKAYDVDIMTRISRGGYSDYIRPLEADSAMIMVPHLMSLRDAEYVRYYTKFWPIGRRPVDGGNADGKYCQVSTAVYKAQANTERCVVVQIEDPEPLAELDAICDVPGIDMIFFGPADFSQGAGIPDQFDNPYLLEVREKVAAAARKHGKWAGTVGSPANIRALADMGYTFVNVCADVTLLFDGFHIAAEAARDVEIRKQEEILSRL